MFRACLLLAILGAVFAAPHWHQPHYGPFGGGPGHFRGHHGSFSDEFFGEDSFDANRFWSQLSHELAELDRALQQFESHFPSSVSQFGIEGDQYKINITLHGYQESDIKVKAKNGVLMIQALHSVAGNVQRQYMDLRTLPSIVSPNGSWTYDGATLRIVFPLTSSPTTTTEVVQVSENPETFPTRAPDFNNIATNTIESKEDMEPTSNDRVGDADIGVERARDRDRDLLTNEIEGSSYDATTYAVDLKDEVEFVPVKY